MEYVQFKNGSPHYYRDAPGPDFNEAIQYQVSITKFFFVVNIKLFI